MRRGSITGPIILILVGGLFLLNNIRPDLSVLDMFSNYWPFLLIVWGILRLIEVLVAASRPAPVYPERAVSGGEWVLVVLLCVFGSGAFFVKRHAGFWPTSSLRAKIIGDFGEPFDFALDEKKVAAAKNVRVIIENFHGNTRIVGADVNEVRVTGRKTVRALQQNEADEANRRTPLEVVTQADAVVVRTNQERGGPDRRVSDDLEITVPKGASIEGRGRLGDFDINDLGGSVEVVSDNSGVRFQNIGGSVRLDLRRSDMIRAVNVKGAVEVKGRGQNIELENIEGQVTISGFHTGDLLFRNLAKPLHLEEESGTLRVERCPGEIRMARGYVNATNLIGPVQIKARSKDIQLNGFTQALDLSLDRGDVELRPGSGPFPKIEVRSNSGDVDLAIPATAKFDIRAEVQKGEISNDWGEPLSVETIGRGARLRGKTGEGASVEVVANRGVVTIRKGDAFSEKPEMAKPPMVPKPPKVPTPEKIVVESN